MSEGGKRAFSSCTIVCVVTINRILFTLVGYSELELWSLRQAEDLSLFSGCNFHFQKKYTSLCQIQIKYMMSYILLFETFFLLTSTFICAGSKSPQYVTRIDTPVLSFPEESSTYPMDNHCVHDWNVPIWEAENCHHYSQLNYSQPQVYCWDYMSAAYPSVCSDHMDSNVSIMDTGIPYSYPMQPYMDDHCFS